MKQDLLGFGLSWTPEARVWAPTLTWTWTFPTSIHHPTSSQPRTYPSALRRDGGDLLLILLIILISFYSTKKAFLSLRSDLQEDLEGYLVGGSIWA